MPDEQPPYIVFTDLDGTLMGHDDYSMQGIAECIAQLQHYHIPVVFNTSKTYAESRSIQQQLGIQEAMIVENGACLLIPQHYSLVLPAEAVKREEYWSVQTDVDRQYIDKAITALVDELQIPSESMTRLSQCSIDQAVTLTGLSPAQAAQAIQREYSEPIIWQGDMAALQVFTDALATKRLRTLQGGRFLHIIGQTDKGVAMQRLLSCYPGRVKTVVLGDSANDLDMLNAADIPVLIQSPANKHLTAEFKTIYTSQQAAPQGWLEAIQHILLQPLKNQETL